MAAGERDRNSYRTDLIHTPHSEESARIHQPNERFRCRGPDRIRRLHTVHDHVPQLHVDSQNEQPGCTRWASAYCDRTQFREDDNIARFFLKASFLEQALTHEQESIISNIFPYYFFPGTALVLFTLNILVFPMSPTFCLLHIFNLYQQQGW